MSKVGSDLIKSLNQALEFERTGQGAKRSIVRIKDVPVYDAASIKRLRKRLNLSQSNLAYIIGVTTKTVEAWEAGTNPPRGPARRMLELIEKQPAIINEYIKII